MLIVRISVADSDRKGATDANSQRIRVIDSWDALGRRSCAQGEHSGQQLPLVPEDLVGELADNEQA
jgi:hypothetical protein